MEVVMTRADWRYCTGAAPIPPTLGYMRKAIAEVTREVTRPGSIALWRRGWWTWWWQA